MKARPTAKTFREQVEGDIQEYDAQKKLSELKAQEEKKNKDKKDKNIASGAEKTTFDMVKDKANETYDTAKKVFQFYTHTDQTQNREEIIDVLQAELAKNAPSDDELYKKYHELFCSIKYGRRQISRLAIIMNKTILLVSNGTIRLKLNTLTNYDRFCIEFTSAVMDAFNIAKPDGYLLLAVAKSTLDTGLSTGLSAAITSSPGVLASFANKALQSIHLGGQPPSQPTNLDIKVSEDVLFIKISRSLIAMREELRNYITQLPAEKISSYAIRAAEIAAHNFKNVELGSIVLTDIIDSSIETAIKRMNPAVKFYNDLNPGKEKSDLNSPKKAVEESKKDTAVEQKHHTKTASLPEVSQAFFNKSKIPTLRRASAPEPTLASASSSALAL